MIALQQVVTQHNLILKFQFFTNSFSQMFTLKLFTILVLPISLFFICILLFKISEGFFKKSFLIDSQHKEVITIYQHLKELVL